MSCSDIVQGTEECNSNESGWTVYIASSPDKEDDPTHDEDDERGSSTDGVNQQESEDDAENMDTDDSMASDASSGPSDRKRLSNAVKKNERKLYAGEKCQTGAAEENGEKTKVEEKSDIKGTVVKYQRKTNRLFISSVASEDCFRRLVQKFCSF